MQSSNGSPISGFRLWQRSNIGPASMTLCQPMFRSESTGCGGCHWWARLLRKKVALCRCYSGTICWCSRGNIATSKDEGFTPARPYSISTCLLGCGHRPATLIPTGGMRASSNRMGFRNSVFANCECWPCRRTCKMRSMAALLHPSSHPPPNRSCPMPIWRCSQASCGRR